MDMTNAILIGDLGSIETNVIKSVLVSVRVFRMLKKNIKFGRPNISKPDNWDLVIAKVDSKQITVTQAIHQLNISCSSLQIKTK